MFRHEGGVETAEITWEDLIRILEERPEWLARVRQVVLTPELLSLPEAIRELRDAQYQTTLQIQELVEVQHQTTLQIRELREVQQRHEERLAGMEERLAGVEDRLSRLEAAVQELVEAQRQTTLQIRELREIQQRHEERLAGVEDRLSRLEAAVQELVEAQRQTTLQIQELREVQQQTTLQIQELREVQQQTTLQIRELREILEQTNSHIRGLEAAVSGLVQSVNAMAESLRTLSTDMARMKGFYLEMQYRQKAHAYFGRLLRSIRVITPIDVEDILEQYLTPEEMEELIPLDLLVSGRLRYHPQRPEVMLAMEISFAVDKDDIRRARKRAFLLRKAGFPAVPAVGGVYVSPEAVEIARTERVVVFEDGRVSLWDEIVPEILGG